MFLWTIWRWLRGWVRFEAEGGFPERLLNLAAGNGITLWNTYRRGSLLTACCRAREYRLLRPLARRTGMRMHLRERYGFPFKARRYHARPGLALGLALYLVLLNWMAGHIWVVRINGLQAADETALRAVLAENGVHIGARPESLHLGDIQMQAIQRLPDISWLAVNPQGSIVNVDIVEIDRDAVPPMSTDPANLVATRDGRIVRMETTNGQAVVQVGDAVVEGQLLISGVVESKTGPLLRHAAGRVLAETSRTLEANVPLTQTQMLPTGEVVLRSSLRLFHLVIPLFTNGVLPDTALCESADCPLTVRNVPLPVGVTLQRYRLMSPQVVQYTEQQAAVLAEKEVQTQEQSLLKDAEILSREQETRVENGVLTLTIRLRCIENITAEQPLLFGSTTPAVP